MKNIALRPVHYASLSGGKDSLYMLGIILANPDKYPLDLAVHFELEIDYPWVSDVIDEMERRLEKVGIKLLRIKPRKTWQELYERFGFPNQHVRWCNTKYKLDCEAQLKKLLKNNGCKPVKYIGLCADETKRFKYEVGNITENSDTIYPLAEEGITEASIYEWAKKQPIFDNYYHFNYRQGCMFCPMASMRELAYMKVFYPDSFDKLMEYHKEYEIIWHRPVNQSNPKYNHAYIIQRLDEKYVPEVLRIMNELEDKNE